MFHDNSTHVNKYIVYIQYITLHLPINITCICLITNFKNATH